MKLGIAGALVFDCRYLIGMSIVRRYAPLAQRCSVLSRQPRL
jgi:hypothetical protein